MLPCGYSIFQSYTGLKRAWRGYQIAINKDEDDLAKRYASVIQKIQREMGIPVTSFPWLKMNKIGEHEDLAHYLAGELRGDEPLLQEEPEQIDPIYAHKSQLNEEENEPEPEYQFKWSAQDFDRLKRFT